MTTITVPAWRGTEPEPEVQADASAVLTDVRAAATGTADVAEWAHVNGVPEGWAGDAAESAAHTVTAYAADTDAACIALERGALAIDAFLTAMSRRRSEHEALARRRTTLNNDRAALIEQIDAATEAEAPALQARASDLATRFTTYDADVQRWNDLVTADEDACIAALRAVDTVEEAAALTQSDGGVGTAGLLRQLSALGSDTDAIEAWWSALAEAQRNALIISDPDLVGNTNGIPTGDRDEANRASVQRDIEWLLAQPNLSAEQHRWLASAQSIETAIANAHRLPYRELDIDVNVMAYQPHAFGGDGVAAVAYGDPDTSDHTAVYVPGIMQNGAAIDENGLDALALHKEASLDGSSVATIAWIGYDSPNWNPDGSLFGHAASALDAAQTVTEANAVAGGRLLAAFVDGLNSTHESGAERSHLTVIGHSYGSTTSAHAAAGGMDSDALVLIGSPGAGGGIDHASQLNLPPGQVYAGSAANDPVSWLGGRHGVLPSPWDDGMGLGEDPTQADFGARVFAVDPGPGLNGVDGLVDTGLTRTHVGYFERLNPALGTMADIVTGHEERVVETGGRQQDAHAHLYDWVGHEVGRELRDAYDDILAPTGDWFDDLWRGGRS